MEKEKKKIYKTTLNTDSLKVYLDTESFIKENSRYKDYSFSYEYIGE